jgi:hypothetical protein
LRKKLKVLTFELLINCSLFCHLRNLQRKNWNGYQIKMLSQQWKPASAFSPRSRAAFPSTTAQSPFLKTVPLAALASVGIAVIVALL